MIPEKFDWPKNGIVYKVKGWYWPAEVGECSFFECTEINPPRELSDDDNLDLWDRADEVYAKNRKDFFESVMQ